MQEIRVWSLGQEDPLEEEMTTHSSNLAWEIPWTEEPGGLQSKWLQKTQTWLSDMTTKNSTCTRVLAFQQEALYLWPPERHHMVSPLHLCKYFHWITVFSNPSCPVLKELSPCRDVVRCLTKNLKSNRLPLPLEWPFRVLKGSHTPSFSWDPLIPATIGLDLYYNKIKYKYGREYRNMKMVGRSGKTIITLWDHCVHTSFCLLSLSGHSPPT